MLGDIGSSYRWALDAPKKLRSGQREEEPWLEPEGLNASANMEEELTGDNEGDGEERI